MLNNTAILEASLTNLFNHMQVHTKFVQAFKVERIFREGYKA